MNIMFTLDPALIIGLLVSTVLPLLVGLVTKQVTHGGVKAVLLAALALATSLLTEIGVAVAANVPYDLGRGLLLAIPTFLIAVGMHYGLWKPVGAASRAQALFDKNTYVVEENTDAKPAPRDITGADSDWFRADLGDIRERLF